MRIIAKSTLKKFWEHPQYADSKASLESWYEEALKAYGHPHRQLRRNIEMRAFALITELFLISAATNTG
jgi:mRNA-degrading endonuclease HigB of HigAB toxin-antitoxin module